MKMQNLIRDIPVNPHPELIEGLTTTTAATTNLWSGVGID